MEDTQRIVKCGNLSLHTPGGFFKKRWHPKYLVLYDGSKSGVKRLELFDSEIKFKKQSPARIIPLVDCVRVVTCQRQKTTYTFEVRTSDQFYLLASQSFQDMTDWVNCLRLVAFGQSQQQQPTAGGSTTTTTSTTPAGNGNINSSQLVAAAASAALAKRQLTATSAGQQNRSFDVLLETRRAQQQQQHQLQQVSATSRGADNVTPAEQVAGNGHKSQQTIMTASQAAAAAASALAKTRQRQPSLLGSCKPQPPTDSPFIHQQQQLNPTSASAISDGLGAGSALGAVLNSIGSMDTLTPTVRGQLISAPAPPTSTATATTLGRAATSSITQTPAVTNQFDSTSSTSSSSSAAGQANVRHSKQLKIQATLDEEEENMLYCSIEDNPSEHNYRVKVIETELSLRCQLKCYQLTAPTLISEQYEELNLFRHSNNKQPQIVTFYQLIIGPQELTLLNDYATASAAAAVNYSPNKQQGLWSWPYQCIRRYGFDKDNCFMFEAGRKCTSGPGQFIVQTPKAYMIYQDVVKFVNELRTVSTTTATNSNSTNQEATNENNNNNNNSSNQAKQLVVTQIPVSWAPNEQANQQQADMKLNNLEINQLPDSLESRKHFFNALRQLDPSAPIDDQDQEQRGLAKQQTPGSTNPASNLHLTRDSPSSPSASSSSSCDSGKRLDSPTMRAKDDKSKGVDSKSETDESGYDQGDDSVDSGSRSFKQQSPSASLLVASRKRQANDSMSSSSSTTSGGSPGQSISRNGRANVKLPSTTTTTNHGQGPAKRPPINGMAGMKAETTKSQPPTENPQQQLGLHHLIADEVLGGAGQATIGGPFNTNPRDFEANLIRDVYSEITKLHAKFAVTSSGSADDSMSSHSSQVESGTSDHLNKSGEEDEGGRDEFDDDFDHLDEIGEPTYSNVRLMPPNRRATEARRMRKRGGDFEESPNYDQENKQFHAAPRHEPQSHHQQLTATNSYSNNNGLDYLSSRQLYPTILNPIPECGELAHPQSNPQPPPPVAPKPQRFLSNNNNPHHRQQQPEMNQHKFNRPQHLSEIPTLIEKGLPRARLATRAMDKPTPHNENQPRGVGKQDHKANNNNVRQSPQTKTTNKMNNNSKLRPTNHYVINDVQYAKISRNLHPNFESCL